MRANLKQLLVLIERVEVLFPSPADVADDESLQIFEMACDVDHLASTVVGGMSAKSITSRSVVEAGQQIDALLVERGSLLTAVQVAALQDLRGALSRAKVQTRIACLVRGRGGSWWCRSR